MVQCVNEKNNFNIIIQWFLNWMKNIHDHKKGEFMDYIYVFFLFLGYRKWKKVKYYI